MAIIKGICKNFGECDLADSKEIQEVDKTNFVCEECGKPLYPVDGGPGVTKTPPSTNERLKKLLLIGGGIVIIIALVFILLRVVGVIGGTPEQEISVVPIPEPVVDKVEKIVLDRTTLTMNVGDKELIKPSVEPEEAKATFVFNTEGDNVLVTEDGEVTALKKGETTITVTCVENPDVNADCKVTVNELQTPPGNGGGGKTPTTYNLGWGQYEGPMSGGKPNGFGGTITVRRSYSIDLKKASGETVQVNPGDKIMNVKMENGTLRQGEIHFSDGTRRYLSGL